MNKQWKIRFLGEVLQGREVWLNEGHLSLGEQGCDLCIPLTENEKIVLTERGGRLFVDAGKAKIRINGRRHRQNTPLPDRGVLQVAGIALAFGDSDSNLTHYSIPGACPWGEVFAGILLLLIGVVGSEFLETGEHSHPDNSLPQRVNLLLQQTGASQMQVHWKLDGSVQLSGYCQSSKQMQKIKVELESLGVMFRDNVICVDQLAGDVKDILIQAGYSHVQVIGQSLGSVLIRADIVMDQRWNTVQLQLAELPGLQHWRIENLHQSQSKAIIAAMVQSGLAGLVSVTPVGQTFVVSGILDQPHKLLLQQTLSMLREQHPLLELSYQEIVASSDGGKYLPAPVAGFIQGRRGNYLFLANGERLRVGSHLPGGGEIVMLTKYAVAIDRDDTLINYPLNF